MLQPLTPEIGNCMKALDVVVPRMLEEEKHGRVNMQHYQVETDCGTAYCFGGWILASLASWSATEFILNVGQISDLLCDLLGIKTDRLSVALFGSGEGLSDVCDIKFRAWLLRRHMEAMIVRERSRACA